MSKSILANNLARTSPLVTSRRDQANIDPLDAGISSGPTTPQRSPKQPVADAAPFQRLLLPAEQLDIDSKNFISVCK